MLSAPRRLRCDFADSPLAVADATPYLSWWVSDTRPAELQSAYEIVAASTLQGLSAARKDLWESGVVASGSCAWVEYGGKALTSNAQVWWKVRTYDSDGLPSPWSDAASFETGLFEASDWQGVWIATPLRGSRSRSAAVPALRREFELAGPLSHARLHIAVLGDYQVEINGRRLTESSCNASWTQFDREIEYHTYDVTTLLLQQTNAIGVLLADGVYAGELSGWGRNHYGERAQMLLQLEIVLADGSREVVCSDGHWLWRPSWIVGAETNGAEHVDYRQLVSGWSEAGGADGIWQEVEALAKPDTQLHPRRISAIKAQRSVGPLQVPRRVYRDGRVQFTYDFGEHMLGRVRAQISSNETDCVCVSYSQNADFSSAVTDTFTTSGAGDDRSIEAQFALHGFRYVRIEHLSGTTDVADVTALRMGAIDLQSVQLKCDHKRLNALFEALNSTLRAGALQVPLQSLDVEGRLPDVGAAGCWVPHLACREDLGVAVNKWCADMVGAAEDVSCSSGFAPTLKRLDGTVQADDVANLETLVQTLWQRFQHSGDEQVLARCYREVRAAALSYRVQFEDLLRQTSRSDLYGGRDANLVANCTAYGALRTCVRIAHQLNHEDDVHLLEKLVDDVHSAVRRRFLTGDGHLAATGQNAYVAALYHGLLQGEELALAQGALVRLLMENSYRPELCSKLVHALLPVLTDAGRLDIAYMVLVQISLPSRLGALDGGATMVGLRPDRVEIAHTSLWEWLLGSLIGFRTAVPDEEASPGNALQLVQVRPMPPLGNQFQAGLPIQSIEAQLQTIQGVFEIEWQILHDRFELRVVIPPGCSAQVIMPDSTEQLAQSGRHHFVMDFDSRPDDVPTLLNVAGTGADGG